MTEQTMPARIWATYFAKEHKVQRCDATTGHTVSSVAYCDSIDRAREFVDALNRADLAERMADALERCAEARMPGEARRIAREALSAFKDAAQ